MARARVLVVDDERGMRDVLGDGLSRRGFDVTVSGSADHAYSELRDRDHDVVLTDLKMPGAGGIELCRRIRENRPDIPVVVMTAFGSLETAVAAIRAGAYDFVTKPIDMDALSLTLDRAAQYRALTEEVKRLRRSLEASQRFQNLIGESRPMKRLYDLIDRVARSDSSVLVTGETGTGKELVALGLHQLSDRKDRPFVAVNCSALPEQLLESELFGHAAGAFTDARKPRSGLFLQASGGTVFLDEIAELPLGLQPKILRALQERTIRPLGADSEVSIDVRVIAATNRDLETWVDEGRFREDLFFRLNVINIDVPPLRARGTDILLLAQHFIERFADRSGKRVIGLLPATADRLLGYPWPGNVRELQNCLERAVALTDYERISVENLPDRIREYSGRGAESTSELVGLAPLEEVERRHVLHVLELVEHNKSLAARILGLDRKTLYRKLEQYGGGTTRGSRGGD